jgi:hypothetical protein
MEVCPLLLTCCLAIPSVLVYCKLTSIYIVNITTSLAASASIFKVVVVNVAMLFCYSITSVPLWLLNLLRYLLKLGHLV